MGSDRFCSSKKPGSGHQGFGFGRLCARGFEGFRVRWVPTGLVVTSVPEVWMEPCGNRSLETRGIKKDPGSGDSVPKVPKVTFYFERALLYFESNCVKLKVNFF